MNLRTTNKFYLFLVMILIFNGLVFHAPDSIAQTSASDRYCGYLQALQAKVYLETQKPGPIDNLLQFVNSLMQKVSLESIEKEAIQKRLSFEDFQKWASEQHSTKVSDHYKPKYLERYLKEVCGEITNSATFGAEPEPQMGVTAEKQFDPSGLPYASDVPPVPEANGAPKSTPPPPLQK